jgi:hypothetical protein
MIGILARAISDYESHDPDIAEFEVLAMQEPSDIAMLRVLMDQHGLGVADFPEKRKTAPERAAFYTPAINNVGRKVGALTTSHQLISYTRLS